MLPCSIPPDAAPPAARRPGKSPVQPTHESRPSLRLACGVAQPARRALIEETPVAVVFDGATQAVLMTSPSDLEDFAVGFALSEGIITDATQLREIEIVRQEAAGGGIEARVWLQQDRSAALTARRRSGIGPVGCGLCGIDSLAKVARALPGLPDGGLRLSREEACAAPELLRAHQPDHDRTRASHAAGFLRPGEGIVLAREDVGRHNALDKLAGALAARGLDPASGALVLTSRVSTEMVQKAVALRVPVVIAVSAATDYAVRLAQRANLTLVTRARGRDCEVLSGGQRIG